MIDWGTQVPWSGARAPRREHGEQIAQADDIVPVDVLGATDARAPGREHGEQIAQPDQIVAQMDMGRIADDHPPQGIITQRAI